MFSCSYIFLCTKKIYLYSNTSALNLSIIHFLKAHGVRNIFYSKMQMYNKQDANVFLFQDANV